MTATRRTTLADHPCPSLNYKGACGSVEYAIADLREKADG